ncbi:jg5851 [Pararge aegeria aegeria]|uniref:Jg5851 protein n=1 Tax=Pararge aegeria aegeria TaxID=348720 RepID=A0A8S4SK83_9NEOP|nr:jg5851 [Pararge aegeria aegeria]
MRRSVEEPREDVWVLRCWSGNPALLSAAFVDPQPGGQTTSNESRGSAGYKRHRIVEFETPFKRHMPSS